MTRILVTGGFGGIGQHVVRYLLDDKENEVTIFDLKNRNNEMVARDIIFQNDKVTINWGDITKPETYPDMSKFDAIIHMAFIIPPLSETLPEKITMKVNVEGTKSFIDVAKSQGFKGKFIFASSVSVFGPTMLKDRPVEPDDPVNPTDRYTFQKAFCEKYLQNSGLKWLILRISAAVNLKVDLKPENLKIMYSIPYNQKFEFVHPMDAALAFANSVKAEVENEILIIAGGEKCRFLYHEMIEKILGVFRLPPPDPSKFTTREYYLSYYNTTRSQELLHYQTRLFDDFVQDFENNLTSQGEFIKIFAPIAKYFI